MVGHLFWGLLDVRAGRALSRKEGPELSLDAETFSLV